VDHFQRSEKTGCCLLFCTFECLHHGRCSTASFKQQKFVYNWLPYLSLELLDSFVCVFVCGWVELKRLRPPILYPLNQIKETFTKLVIPYFVKVCVSQLTAHNISDSPGFVIIVACEASVLIECDFMSLAK
jgi:hypothetical protein